VLRGYNGERMKNGDTREEIRKEKKK